MAVFSDIQAPAPILTLTASVAPNPANDNTTLSFTLPVDANVRVEVVNSLQQVVATPINAQSLAAGMQTISIPTSALATGAYTVRIIAVAQNGTIYRAVRRLAARRIGTLKKPNTVSSSQNTSNNSSSLRLSVNPNPASSTIIASYILEEESSVTLEVLNILQQKQISPVVEPAKLLGKHDVDMNVSHFQTGTYYIRCTSVSREGVVRQQTIPFQVIK
jgi:hypothetical protein